MAQQREHRETLATIERPGFGPIVRIDRVYDYETMLLMYHLCIVNHHVFGEATRDGRPPALQLTHVELERIMAVIEADKPKDYRPPKHL